MRGWAAQDWRISGPAWIAVVLGGDHLDSERRQNMTVGSKANAYEVIHQSSSTSERGIHF